MIKPIEGQPVAKNKVTCLKQIYFQCGAIPYWKPNVPGEQYNEHQLCLDPNAEEIQVVWSEDSNGEVRFEDLNSSDQNKILELLGLENNGIGPFTNWLLNQGEELEFIEVEPECKLRRAVSFPKTTIHEDEPANGIFFRNRYNNILCRSQSGWYWSEKWVTPVIRLKFG